MTLNLQPTMASPDGPPEGDPQITITLPPLFMEWLHARAIAHGADAAEHAAQLLRLAWQTDQWRLGQQGGATTLQG